MLDNIKNELLSNKFFGMKIKVDESLNPFEFKLETLQDHIMNKFCKGFGGDAPKEYPRYGKSPLEAMQPYLEKLIEIDKYQKEFLKLLPELNLIIKQPKEPKICKNCGKEIEELCIGNWRHIKSKKSWCENLYAKPKESKNGS